MVRDPLGGEEDPDLEVVLEALSDEDCRVILEAHEEPQTASDLLERVDVPRSTLYRKLDQLTDATLLFEGTELRSDGSHAGRYEVDFTEVVFTRGPGRALGVEIERPARSADERLAELWSEVRKEM